mgnify:CR=1 FL=1
MPAANVFKVDYAAANVVVHSHTDAPVYTGVDERARWEPTHGFAGTVN